MKPPLLIHGMHGLGDNIRQRAIIRQKMRTHDVWIESSWVSVYHDLVADGLNVIHKGTRLRTQAKNAQREASLFSRQRPTIGAKAVQVWYPPAEVRRTGSVLGAMCKTTGCDVDTADFRLPIPAAWRAKAQVWLDRWHPTKPIMIYRPLVDRPSDWTGCNARNPDHASYKALFDAIRDSFFVVSVADLDPMKEWIVGREIIPDAACHRGELDFESLAALTSMAALMFCSPGFAAVLAQAVGTPVACVFGGYEKSSFFFAGAKDAPTLGIDPINPCDCFKHDHDCRKTIDLPSANERLQAFAADAAGRSAIAA